MYLSHIWNTVLIGLALVVGVTNSQGQPDAIDPVNFNVLNLQPQGGALISPEGQPYRVPEDPGSIDWLQRDRRQEENWWHLYPFGERFFDQDIIGRPWNDQQIDLDFFFPYYGFRFNYTFIYPEGFVAFSYPWYIQPPYTYPNPRWPDDPDPSLIAAFMTEQQAMFIGDTSISHVWYRVISRPSNLIGQGIDQRGLRGQSQQIIQGTNIGSNWYGGQGARYYRTYRGQVLKTTDGRVEDPELLDLITE